MSIKSFISATICMASFFATCYLVYAVKDNTTLSIFIFISGTIFSFWAAIQIDNIMDNIQIKNISHIFYFKKKKKILKYLSKIADKEFMDNIFIDKHQKEYFLKKAYYHVKNSRIEDDIKDCELLRRVLSIIGYTIMNEIIYNNDFICRGVPGFKTSEDIKCFLRLIEYMANKGIISKSEKEYALHNLKEEISNIG